MNSASEESGKHRCPEHILEFTAVLRPLILPLVGRFPKPAGPVPHIVPDVALPGVMTVDHEPPRTTGNIRPGVVDQHRMEEHDGAGRRQQVDAPIEIDQIR